MYKLKNIVIVLLVLICISSLGYGIGKVVQISNDISLEEIQECNTLYWTEPGEVYTDCMDTQLVPVCQEGTANSSCDMEIVNSTHSCKIITMPVGKTKEVCKDKELRINIQKATNELKKYQLNYEDWGKCSYSSVDDSVIILCDSKYDGNGDGICQEGESCISFIVTKDNIQRLFRNSRIDFVADDYTFYQKKLDVEVI